MATNVESGESSKPGDLKEYLQISSKKDENGYVVEGELAVFVPCGSQLSFWAFFPRTIQFTLLLANGETKTSIDSVPSVNFDQSTIDYYAQQPCDRVVTESFSIAFKELFWELPDGLQGAEMRGNYYGIESNLITLK